MALRRGFKSEAEAIAREVRLELGVAVGAPMDPWQLAAHLEIPVLRLSEFVRLVPQSAKQLLAKNKSAFSAVMVFKGTTATIVVNDAHSRARQASNLTHEIAHRLLLHDPGPAFQHDGVREWNGLHEQEADWLAGALLVTDAAAVAIVRDGIAVGEAARQYGVSAKMMQFRINVTGAARRIARAASYRAPAHGARR